MSGIFQGALLATAFLMTTHAHVLPRQDASPIALVPPPAVVPSSTSSFNWWPYPPGGVTTSSLIPVPTTTPTPTVPSSTSVSSTSTDSGSSSSTSTVPSTTSPSSSSLSQVTAITSLPASLLSSPTPHTPYRQHNPPFNKLFLIPVCVFVGAALGCAFGWVGFRLWEKRKQNDIQADGKEDGYAWAYPGEKDESGGDQDMERGHGHGPGPDYLSLGHGPSPALRADAPTEQRNPSNVSASGAQTRTWIERAQARKRSGGMATRQASSNGTLGRGRGHVREGADTDHSPLLGSPSDLDPAVDSEPLPASPHPSPYLYGDDDVDDDAPPETIRHKSIRRRIWERLGFGDGDLGRRKTRGKGPDGRNTWSGAAREEERDAKLGRSTSLWGRARSRKEGRVERWVKDVMAEDGEEAETPLQCPALDNLGRISSTSGSPSKPRSADSDDKQADVLMFEGSAPVPYLSLRDKDPTPFSSPKDIHPRSGGKLPGQRGSTKWKGGELRRVSLQDPGPVGSPRLVSKGQAKKTPRALKIALARCPSPSIKPSRSQTETSLPSPTPPTPSTVSKYSATPRTPAPATNSARATRRTPTPSAPPKDTVRHSNSKATPPSSGNRPSPAATPSSRGSGTSPRSRPTTARPTRPPPQGRSAQLPPSPALVTFPPLQSALCFETPPPPPRTPPRASAAARKQGTRLPTSHTRHSPQSMARTRPSSIASGATQPIAHVPPRSGYQGASHMPEPIAASAPGGLRSPKERHLARRGANARVGMIISRSYSSRDLGDVPTSPNMFGAVISEEDVPEMRLDDELSHDIDAPVENVGREGIEQLLDRLKR